MDKSKLDSLSRQPSLSDVIRSYLEKTANLAAVMSAFYSDQRVSRCVVDACFRKGCSRNDVDEIKQDLAILLIHKFIKTIKDPEKIYNVLHVAACHIARRKTEKIKEFSIEDLAVEEPRVLYNKDDPVGDDPVVRVIETIDRHKAVEEFNRRLTGQLKNLPHPLSTSLRLSVVNKQPVLIERPLKPKRLTYREESPSNAGKELGDIRKELGYTVPQFAELLNTSRGTLCSYLYGIVKTVPAQILNEARLLKTSANNDFQEFNKKICGMSMGEIIEQWIVLLGLQEHSKKSLDAQLAEILGVDRATIWRWRERDMRPEVRRLKEYDEIVRSVVVA